MTPVEQQQVNSHIGAMRAHYEQMCGNLATSGAEKAVLAESYARQLKAAQDELADLKKPKDNVVPIAPASA